MWLSSFKGLEGVIARWLEKLGQLNWEIRHNARKDTPHANCLSRVQTKEYGMTTFVTILPNGNAATENDTPNPWQVLQETE